MHRNLVHRYLAVSLSLAICSITLPGIGQLPPVTSREAAGKTNWNIPMRTLGGKQFWTDHLIHGQWRIQQNVMTKHFRLLDPQNHRRIWGTWQECFTRWQKIKQEDSIPGLKPRVVICLHGLIRSRGSMEGIAQSIARHGDFSTMCFSYASTRAEVCDHAKALRDVVGHLDGVEEIDFVAHSLGNLVIRHFLKDQMDSTDQRQDKRIKRIVMLAPPNNGAQLAERMQTNPAFKLIFGISGGQLAKNWDQLASHLATPTCEFGIIAAESDSWVGTNPLLDGKDDFVVRVEETRLPGAHDFLVVPGLHSFIMDQEKVQQSVLRFLEHGYFVSEAARVPIQDGTNEPSQTRTDEHE